MNNAETVFRLPHWMKVPLPNGEKCTRNCRFCYLDNLIPDPLDWEEPGRLADTIKKLELKHCVLTSVAREWL